MSARRCTTCGALLSEWRAGIAGPWPDARGVMHDADCPKVTKPAPAKQSTAPRVRLFTDLTAGEKSAAYVFWRDARRANSWVWGGQGVMWPIPAGAHIATPGRETWVTASPFDLLTFAEELLKH